MRTFAIAAIVASLVVMPAYAQKDMGDPAKEEGNKAEAEKKKKNEESERQFRDAVQRIRDPEQAVKKRDPWGNIR